MENNKIYKNKTKGIISFSIMALIVLMGVFFTSPSDMAYAQDSFDFIDSSDVQLDDNDKSKELFFNPMFGNVDDFSFQDSPIAGVVMAFNAAVLFIAGILAAYTMIAGTVNTAHDGELLGRRWSSAWMPIRTAMGAAALLPVFQGFCFAQVLVIWLAMQGSGLANYTWNKYNENIQDSVNFVNTYQSTELNRAAFNMFFANVCHYALIKESSKPNIENVLSNVPKYQIGLNYKNKSMVFKYGVDSNYVIRVGNNKGKVVEGSPLCGAYEMRLVPNGLSGDDLQNKVGNAIGGGEAGNTLSKVFVPSLGVNDTTKYLSGSDMKRLIDTVSEAQRKSLIELQNRLEVIARQFVERSSEVPNGYPNINLAQYDFNPMIPIYNATTTYNLTIKRMVDQVFEDKDFLSDFKENIDKDGWLYAGAWYMKIVQLQSTINNMTKIVPESSTIPMHAANTNSEVGRQLTSAIRYMSKYKSGIDAQTDTNRNPSADAGRPELGEEYENVRERGYGERAVASFAAFGSAFVGVASNIIDTARAVGHGARNLVDGNSDPVETIGNATVSSFKEQLSGAAEDSLDYFIGIMSSQANPVMAAQALGSFSIGAGWRVFALSMVGGAISTGAAFSGVALAASLFTVGAGLSVVLPMTPFIIWVSVVLSWMILVCQAVIGAPLWAVAHMHPDADGIVGKAGQGYMLILGLTIKPALMIVGLVISLTIILPFGYFFNSIFISAFKLSQASGIGIIALIAVLFLYWSMMMMIIKKTFSLIYAIPDTILQWLGAGLPQLGQGAEQMKDQSKQELSNAMSKAQSGAGQAASVLGQSYMGASQANLASAGVKRHMQDAQHHRNNAQSARNSAAGANTEKERMAYLDKAASEENLASESYQRARQSSGEMSRHGGIAQKAAHSFNETGMSSRGRQVSSNNKARSEINRKKDNISSDANRSRSKDDDHKEDV